MKSLIAILLLIILSPLLLLAQSRISGTLTDKESKQPVEYASVYIDGTTNGTLSDSLGNFHLHNVHFPCFLVVSHLSYKTLSLELENATVSPLTMLLKLKVNEIKEISVQDKNLR